MAVAGPRSSTYDAASRCPPRKALLIAALVFASCWIAATAVFAVPGLAGRADSLISAPPSWHTLAALRIADNGPLSLYQGQLSWADTGYQYLPLPALLDSVTVVAGKALFGHPAVSWGGMTLWVHVYVAWGRSAAMALLAWAVARRCGERLVAPVVLAAAVSGAAGPHFEEALLCAALIAGCGGSRLGGAASLLVKQTAAAMTLPLLWARRRDRRFLLAAVGGAALVLAPFALADTDGFLRGVLFAASDVDYALVRGPWTVRGLVPWPSYVEGRIVWVAASAVFAVWAARRGWSPLAAAAVIAAARNPLFEAWPEHTHFAAGFVLCAAAAGGRSQRAAWAACAAAAAFRLWYADWGFWGVASGLDTPFFPELPVWQRWDTASIWQVLIWWAVALPLIAVPAWCAASSRRDREPAPTQE